MAEGGSEQRRRRGAPAADALPAAQHPAPDELQGPQRGEYGADAALEKGAGVAPGVGGEIGNRRE